MGIGPTQPSVLPAVSVIMPTWQQARFIERAIVSVIDQTFESWELIIVDDCSPDDTAQIAAPYLGDSRIHYHHLPENRGLGAALNFGLDVASGRLISYLPSDDVYYPEHLQTLVHAIDREDAALAISGVRHHYNRSSEGRIEGSCIQLVQSMHRSTPVRWIERIELVSDDLDRLFWSTFLQGRSPIQTYEVTCEWVDHPDQLHKLLQEPVGGINPFRQRFNVQHPLRFHSTQGSYIDEVSIYDRFRSNASGPASVDGASLSIVLCGELAYNPERVLAFEERGHRLHGLWMGRPYWYNTVGPLPFGNVVDLPRSSWRSAIREIKPDIIYAGFNWQAVPFIHEVLQAMPEVPLVFHFKEGPFICLEKGTWPELVDLYTGASGVIYCNPEMQGWLEGAIPSLRSQKQTMILDADLPKAVWQEGRFSPPLSETQSGKHTVVPGRPIGLHPQNVVELAENDIHLHFYGDFTHGQWQAWIEKVSPLAPNHLHLHAQVDQPGWVEEFSQYDAGWLHFVESQNAGDIRRSNWDDLNYPARMATLVAAGLPLLQYDNRHAALATDALSRRLGIGLFFKSMRELRERLDDRAAMTEIRQNVLTHRQRFTFDYHYDRLIEFFRDVIRESRPKGLGATTGSPPDRASSRSVPR